jgi:hypothetical protein
VHAVQDQVEVVERPEVSVGCEVAVAHGEDAGLDSAAHVASRYRDGVVGLPDAIGPDRRLAALEDPEILGQPRTGTGLDDRPERVFHLGLS